MSLNTEDYRGPVYGNQEQEMVEVEGTPLNIPGNKDKEKKRNRKQKQKSSGENPIVAFFTDKRFRIVFGTILMLSAIFLLISGISYFAYGAADQSLVTAHPILANAESNNIKNYGGPLGAFLSEFFFEDYFSLQALRQPGLSWKPELAVYGRVEICYRLDVHIPGSYCSVAVASASIAGVLSSPISCMYRSYKALNS